MDSKCTGWRRRANWSTGVVLVIIAIAVIFFVAYDPWQRISHSISGGVAAAVIAVVAGCGVGLAAVIRSLARMSASLGRWLRRSAAGALLLTPAVRLLSRPFEAAGYDFDTCGSLLAPFRPAGADYAEFRSQCDSAANGRLLHAVLWTAAGCVVAVAYGLWLRWRQPRQLGTSRRTMASGSAPVPHVP